MHSGVIGFGAVAVEFVGEPLGDAHPSPVWADRLVGEQQRVCQRGILTVVAVQFADQPEHVGHHTSSGMVRHQATQARRPAVCGEIPDPVEGMEPGVANCSAVSDVVQPGRGAQRVTLSRIDGAQKVFDPMRHADGVLPPLRQVDV